MFNKNNTIWYNKIPTQPPNNHPLSLPSWNLTPMHRGKALSHHRPSNPIHYAWHIGVGMWKFPLQEMQFFCWFWCWEGHVCLAKGGIFFWNSGITEWCVCKYIDIVCLNGSIVNILLYDYNVYDSTCTLPSLASKLGYILEWIYRPR